MYVPRHFAETDLARLDELVAHDAFATLVSLVDGSPFASHLPVLYARDGDAVRFRGHWARGNPQWRGIAAQKPLLILHGPHAYVSPTWYADPDRRVPTWNYATAHVYGRMTVTEDLGALQDIVVALADRYEGKNGSNWRFDAIDESKRRELRGIVGFELVAERIELKLKLNQNHPLANVDGAIAGLRGVGSDDARAVADWMTAARGRRPDMVTQAEPAA